MDSYFCENYWSRQYHHMSELTKTKFESLQFALKFPRVYLSSHFDEMIHQIDISAEEEISKIESNRPDILDADDLIALLNRHRQEMLDKLKVYSKDLIDRAHSNDSKELLKELENSFHESDCQNNMAPSEVNTILDVILFKLHVHLFGQKCVVFLEKKIFESSTFGTLIFVNDEFIDQKGIEYLK